MGFLELNIATSGLFAAQRGLQVTSNNISNANTTGYSRQVLNQKASSPLGGIGVGMTGTGVSTTGISRVRDSYIDQKLWTRNPKLGEYTVKVTQNSIIESAFGEPSDTGFTEVFNGLFTGMSQLNTDPSSDVYKIGLKEEMVSFTKYFNTIASTLKNYQQDLNFDLKNTVNEINNLSTHIQSLNKQIMEAEIYGDEANSLRDERDNCIDRLSEIIDIEVQETEYEVEGNTVNKLTIKAAGQNLVDHLNCNTLQVKVREAKLNEEDAEGLYDIEWRNGTPFDMKDVNMSGELKGIIDMRDGCGTGKANSYNGIPYYIKSLDDYVSKFAEAMNKQYNEGADQSSNYALFTYTEDSTGEPVEANRLTDYSKITASNFSVSKEILDDPTSMRTLYDESDASDTSFMLNLLRQKDNKEMFQEGDPKDYMIAIFSGIGIRAKEAEMYQNTQKSVVQNLTNQRLSMSQVDITEEFTYLIQYQQAYQAAAKVINTMDGIYETTLFKLGNF